jgi:uncharacterized protein (DUF169 family)
VLFSPPANLHFAQTKLENMSYDFISMRTISPVVLRTRLPNAKKWLILWKWLFTQMSGWLNWNGLYQSFGRLEDSNREEKMDNAQNAEAIYNQLRLRTVPIGVKFLDSKTELHEKAKRPATTLGKRITICQAVTMARVYQWSMGLAREDLICVPAMIAFGFTNAPDQKSILGKLFCNVTFQKNEDNALRETQVMSFLANKEFEAIALAPLHKAPFDPDVAVMYGNPAQIMRLIQAWSYQSGGRIEGTFGGKVECTEYLIAPMNSGNARVAIPGMGDRIFSTTQDDEMTFSLPARHLASLVEGLSGAGKKIGARYPITFYQNFQPEFPDIYKKTGKELGAFDE